MPSVFRLSAAYFCRIGTSLIGVSLGGDILSPPRKEPPL
ncbi:unnamed protein product [Arabidopsis lyrata]|nr:unnamed protein product [Arabidopsis lyrata]